MCLQTSSVSSARLRDCWRRMRHFTASPSGMTRVVSTPAVIKACYTEWKPCQGLDGSLKDLYIKMSWNPNGQHLRRYGTGICGCGYLRFRKERESDSRRVSDVPFRCFRSEHEFLLPRRLLQETFFQYLAICEA